MKAKPVPKQGPRMKILVIRFSALGDLVLGLPALRDLAYSKPKAELHWLTLARFENLLAPLPEIDNLWTFPGGGGPAELRRLALRLRAERFDLIIDLHASPRSRALRLLLGQGPRYFAVRRQDLRRRRLLPDSLAGKLLGPGMAATPSRRRNRDTVRRALGDGYRAAPEERYPLAPDIRHRVDVKLREMGMSPCARPLAIAPGAAWPSKIWPYYSDLIDALPSELPVLLFGGPDEEETCNSLARGENRFAFCGDRPFPEVAAALDRCRALLGGDTGLGHLAEALEIPTLILFGPTVPAFGFAPRRPESRIIQRSLACRPCSLHGSAPCRFGHLDCLSGIPIGNVLGELRAMDVIA